jgi:predicted acetyltransferase
MTLELVKPTLELEQEYYSFVDDWEKANEKIVPYSARLLGSNYYQWLKKTEKNITIPEEGFVTSHTYFLIDENKQIIGAISIRHELNNYLYNFGGHIGYGIRPSYRRQGYATEMLRLALLIARQIGLEKVLITCDKNNIASAKTIINNDGVLENEVISEKEITQRYWIALTK